MAVPMPIPRVVVALKTEEDILAIPSPSLEMGRPDGIDTIPRPHQITIVTKDIRPSLAWTVLLGRSVMVASKWSDEEISFLNLAGRWNSYV